MRRVPPRPPKIDVTNYSFSATVKLPKLLVDADHFRRLRNSFGARHGGRCSGHSSKSLSPVTINSHPLCLASTTMYELALSRRPTSSTCGVGAKSSRRVSSPEAIPHPAVEPPRADSLPEPPRPSWRGLQQWRRPPGSRRGGPATPSPPLVCDSPLERSERTPKGPAPGACLLYTSPSPRDRQKSRMP